MSSSSARRRIPASRVRPVRARTVSASISVGTRHPAPGTRRSALRLDASADRGDVNYAQFAQAAFIRLTASACHGRTRVGNTLRNERGPQSAEQFQLQPPEPRAR
ncbi:hypothetical protein [Massilia sp. WG5]|uniref:hypothetical protein n=1 Tax=Massilia sp. WG5 TaxID=1707785 RepID=UPI0013A58CFC|nr:hypothetical protein [Massilia sp. WG5]